MVPCFAEVGAGLDTPVWVQPLNRFLSLQSTAEAQAWKQSAELSGVSSQMSVIAKDKDS